MLIENCCIQLLDPFGVFARHKDVVRLTSSAIDRGELNQTIPPRLSLDNDYKNQAPHAMSPILFYYRVGFLSFFIIGNNSIRTQLSFTMDGLTDKFKHLGGVFHGLRFPRLTLCPNSLAYEELSTELTFPLNSRPEIS